MNWDWYKAEMAGRPTDGFPVSDGTFFWLYGHDPEFRRVAIFPSKDGSPAATVDGKRADPARVFADFLRPNKRGTCVPYDLWMANRDKGEPFPKQRAAQQAEEERAKIIEEERAARTAAAVMQSGGTGAAAYLAEDRADAQQADEIARLGHNQPPERSDDDPETLREKLAELTRTFEAEVKRMRGRYAEREFYSFVSELSQKAGAIEKRARTCHTAEKAPHLEAGRAVDAKWKPPVLDAETLKKRCQEACKQYLLKEREEQRLANLRAEESRRQMAERGADPAGSMPGPRRGSGVKAKTVLKAEIVDLKAFFAHMCDTFKDGLDAEIRARMGVIATRMVAAGVKDIPGVTVVEDIQLSN